MQTLYIDPKDQQISAIAHACYPNYSGKKYQIATANRYHLENYWSGGSRTYVVAYNLDTKQIQPAPEVTANPMNGAAHSEIEIPLGVAMVEHVYFCGKDLGVRIVVRPESLAPLLPKQEATTLTDRQLSILATIRSYVSSYRKEVFARHNVAQEEKDELARLGYLTKQGGLTIQGKNTAQSATPLARY